MSQKISLIMNPQLRRGSLTLHPTINLRSGFALLPQLGANTPGYSFRAFHLARYFCTASFPTARSFFGYLESSVGGTTGGRG